MIYMQSGLLGGGVLYLGVLVQNVAHGGGGSGGYVRKMAPRVSYMQKMQKMASWRQVGAIRGHRKRLLGVPRCR